MTTFVLDGKTVTVRAGMTLLDACRGLGVTLPTLCHLDGVSAAASCRLCLVEVKGLPRPVPACATPAWEGMQVTTRTAALERHRRAVVEMLFADGNHVCASCPASGACELQDLAQALGLDHVRIELPRRAPPIDASRPRFLLDRSRCVLCTRCVRACAEIERAGTLGVAGRGVGARIVTDGGARWADSPTCTDCGRCVAACPTGAILDKAFAARGLALVRDRSVASPVLAEGGGPAAPARRLRLATVQLGGCSGCHMSFLDLDERLLDLARRVDLVYSPLTDAKAFPPDVDVCLVEGAVSGDDQLELLRSVRERTRVLVALGDCAGWGNVTALRDVAGGAEAVLRRVRAREAAPPRGDPPLPALLDRVRPVPEVVGVDLFLPGCPPEADLIADALASLLAGRPAAVAGRGRFG